MIYICCSHCACCACSWWRHQMKTVSALLAICAGNSPVPGELPAQKPVTRHFDVFFDLRPNKRLSKQSWGWWLETPSYSLWRHHNVLCAFESALSHYIRSFHTAIGYNSICQEFQTPFLKCIVCISVKIIIKINIICQSDLLNARTMNCVKYPILITCLFYYFSLG